MIGEKLGAYRLEEEIGRGGMGIVYRAVQETLNRVVAVKVLAPHLVADPEFVARFLREARAAANLEHPGIVTVYDVGHDDSTYYFAMQLMPGMTLEQVVRAAGRLEVGPAAGVGIQIADALSYAHREGIYHRDIKSANILIDRSGRCVLTDFGIAWAASETRLTRAGTSLGSPDFMSPEAVSGNPTDGRSDLYSLGVMLFQALTGELPYSGETAVSVAYQHLNAPTPDVRERIPALSPELGRIVGRLMAKQPEDRYQDAAEVRDDLWRLTGGVIAALPGVDSSSGVATPSLTPTPLDLRTLTSPMQPPKRRSLVGLGLLLSILGLATVGVLYVTLARPFSSTPPTPGGGPSSGPGGLSAPPADATATSQESTQGPENQGGAAARPGIRVVRFESEPSGAEIWIDGVDRRLLTPADVEIEGEDGRDVQVALVRDGATVARHRLTLGPDLPAVWRPEIAATESFTITSRPSGAAVVLSGRRLTSPTPVTVDLLPEELHDIRLELDGYESSGLTFRLEDLSAPQRDSGELHFPLSPAVPPGRLAVRAEYAIVLTIGGDRIEVSPGDQRVELPPGRYDVALSAPSVFYSDSRSVEIRADEESVLRLPPVVSVTVAAAPGRCRVAIDGREVDYVPFTVELTEGEHTFEFSWETLGVSRSVRRRVTADTKRLFEAAGDES